MSSGIFLIQQGGQLVEMTEQPYDSEELLQRLLADYPSVLAGDQVNRATPRRWLLVSREMSVPSEEGGAGRWSLDHLFLDQDSIPTLVEVKRSTDTRIRREVVGQMLDYAANAVVYWPADALRARFEAQCEARGHEPERVLTEQLGSEIDPERFWQAARTNLLAGRVRLVFVADVIPPELRRIVEFLNGQMSPAEVLAVEIRQYVGGELRTLVPHVVGQTAGAQQQKSVAGAGRREWSEETFFVEFGALRSPEEVATARMIFAWGDGNPLQISWPRSARLPSFYLRCGEQPLGGVGSNGAFAFDVVGLRRSPPFDQPEKRIELLRRLNQIPGVSMKLDAGVGYPGVPLALLRSGAALDQLRSVLDWIVQELRSPEAQ